MQHKAWRSRHGATNSWRDGLTEEVVAPGGASPPRADGGNLPAPAGYRPTEAALAKIEPMELLKNPLRVWAQHREFRAVLAELNGRSDHELEELGLARGDIARIAYEEAERRIVTPASSEAKAPTPAWHDPALAPGWYRLSC